MFGAGAYAAGIACVNGVTEPMTLIGIGAIAGAVAGLLMGAIMLRAHGLAQLVLSIAIVQLFHEAANKASAYTGGSDGLAGLIVEPALRHVRVRPLGTDRLSLRPRAAGGRLRRC